MSAFDTDDLQLLTSPRSGFVWGYGHHFVFASAAAVGAGLTAAIDHEEETAHLSAGWLLHVVPRRHEPPTVPFSDVVAFPVSVVLVVATSFAPGSLYITAILVTALVAVTLAGPNRREPGRPAPL